MRNVSDKSRRHNHNRNSVLNNFFLENCAVYEIMCEKYGTASPATGDKMRRRKDAICVPDN